MGPAAAEALEQSGDWSSAGAAWMRLAQAEGKPELAATYASRASDAHRRADEPGDAVTAMRFALTKRPATVHDAVLLTAA
jgi:hypothetical protein